MPSAWPTDLLVTAARLYYQEKRTQREIGRILGLSQSAVSRLLIATRARGIVRFHVLDPRSGTEALI